MCMILTIQCIYRNIIVRGRINRARLSFCRIARSWEYYQRDRIIFGGSCMLHQMWDWPHSSIETKTTTTKFVISISLDRDRPRLMTEV